MIKSILLFTIKLSIVMLSISLFIFNLQIQHFDSKGNLTGTETILQVDDLVSNLHAYFIEDCNIICIPDKRLTNIKD